VFRAYNPDRDQLVAVKAFSVDLPPERVHRLVAQFERLIAADLTHPSIVAPLAAGIQGAVAYLAQEYVAADSLDVVLRDGRGMSAADALRLATHLASALDFAAAARLDHGGLHPRDVLLSQGEMRLTGLGVARALERVSVVPPIRRPYTAPERMDGGTWDGRADVFSLAALLCELLWGRRINAVGAEAANGLAALPGGNLDTLRSVFARALAIEPAERFGTASEFAESLGRAFPGIEATTASAPSSGRARRPRRPQGEELLLPLDAAEPAAPSTGMTLDWAARLEEARPADVEASTGVEPDLDLRAADVPGHDAGRQAPAVAALGPAAKTDLAAVPPPPGVTAVHPIAASFDAAVERSRSAVWPLGLALVTGLAVGFAGGYGFGVHERTSSGVEDGVAAVVAAPQTPSVPGDPTPATTSEVRPPMPTPAPAVVPPPTIGARSGTGRLQIRTTPAGARVFVDGDDYGLTPVAVRGLASGPHVVRFVRDGYAPVERRVLITASRPVRSMSLTLARVAADKVVTAAPAQVTTGSVAIESRPEGARVFIDDKLVGTTPLQVLEVAAGVHAVGLEHDGYRRWTSSVRVVSGERIRVTASLEK
jgi:hypothetical protein